MEGEQQPVVIIHERRLYLVFHGVGLAVELRAQVGNFDWLTILIRSLEGNLAGLGLPLPNVRKLEESWDLTAPGVADGVDLPERIKAIGLGNLFYHRRALLCQGRCSKEQHPKN